MLLGFKQWCGMQNIRSLEAGALNREFRSRCLKWEIRKIMLRKTNLKVGVPRDESESWCYCSERGIKAWSEGCDWPHPANGPTALNVWKLSANRREKVLSRRNKGLDTFLPSCADFQDDNYWSFRDSGPNNRSNTFYLSHPMPTIWNQLAAQTKLQTIAESMVLISFGSLSTEESGWLAECQTICFAKNSLHFLPFPTISQSLLLDQTTQFVKPVLSLKHFCFQVWNSLSNTKDTGSMAH